MLIQIFTHKCNKNINIEGIETKIFGKTGLEGTQSRNLNERSNKEKRLKSFI